MRARGVCCPPVSLYNSLCVLSAPKHSLYSTCAHTLPGVFLKTRGFRRESLHIPSTSHESRSVFPCARISMSALFCCWARGEWVDRQGWGGSLDARLVFTLAGSRHPEAPPLSAPPTVPSWNRPEPYAALQVGREQNIPPWRTWGGAAATTRG